MDHLPLKDIPMLVSCINFLLRKEKTKTRENEREQI